LELEYALGNLEGGIANLFSLVDSIGCLPPPKTGEHFSLLFYILAQSGRTQYAADQADEMVDKMTKHLFAKKVELECDGANLENFNIGIKDASKFALGTTVKNYPLLVNKTSEEFVTSDNPVVMYNQLFSFRKIGSNTGLAVKGLQIFFPLSPKKLVVLYDGDVYRVGNDSRHVVEVNSYKDIYNLNVLQVCSSEKNIYFRSKLLNTQALYKKAKPYLRDKKVGLKIFPAKDEKMQKKEIILNYREDISCDLSLSFLTIRKRMKEWINAFKKKKYQPSFVVRNQELLDAHKEFLGLMDDGKLNATDFFSFLEDRDEKNKGF